MAGDKALIGSAGVHYVAFQLSSRGHATGLTAPGVRAVDLLASNSETVKSVSIQVKTMRVAHVDVGKPDERWKWRIGRQLGEGHGHKDFFLALVDLRMLGDVPPVADASWHPDVFIVKTPLPQKLVWRYGTNKTADFWLRIFLKDAYKYHNRWDLIDAALA